MSIIKCFSLLNSKVLFLLLSLGHIWIGFVNRLLLQRQYYKQYISNVLNYNVLCVRITHYKILYSIVQNLLTEQTQEFSSTLVLNIFLFYSLQWKWIHNINPRTSRSIIYQNRFGFKSRKKKQQLRKLFLFLIQLSKNHFFSRPS